MLEALLFSSLHAWSKCDGLQMNRKSGPWLYPKKTLSK
jgi:hypothetical protein